MESDISNIAPCVIYYTGDGGTDLKHKSLIFVSDELSHTSSTVLTFLEEIIKQIKSLKTKVKTVHYWTDSPTSQYRNKVIFNFVANHEATYGFPALWNYFEAGHGKGPCDGVRGTVNRMADEAVRSGKVTIQDAKDFYSWSKVSGLSKMSFLFVSNKECALTASEIAKSPLCPVKNTMKVHAVKGLGNSSIAVRDVSCYCRTCRVGEMCEGYSEVLIKPSKQTEPDSSGLKSKEQDQHLTYTVGCFVEAVYENRWYIGEVLAADSENGMHEYEIRFMEE